MNAQTPKSKVCQMAFNRVKAWSNETLLSVWEAANSRNARPAHGWGTFIDGSWIVITWDDWCEILYSEINIRDLKAR